MSRKLFLGLLKKVKILPAPLYMKIYYRYYTGKKLDLKNPGEFNAKIQWIKIYYRPKILSQLVDKYAVREYVREKIGAQYLNELIAVYNSAADVNFDQLPDQFVIKAVHGYNFNLIVSDKRKLNRRNARFKMYKWMSRNQYWRGGLEWAYKAVKPRLIAEKYLAELGKEDLVDYKFYCFDGIPRFVQIDVDRNTGHKRAYYDPNWNPLPFNNRHYKKVTEKLDRPPKFSEMLEVCQKLAKNFPFVRVDLYNLSGRILFGEMTFYPGDGRLEYTPDEYNKIIGDYLKLPEIPENEKYITAFP